jgi:hypothetical protein
VKVRSDADQVFYFCLSLLFGCDFYRCSVTVGTLALSGTFRSNDSGVEEESSVMSKTAKPDSYSRPLAMVIWKGRRIDQEKSLLNRRLNLSSLDR